MEMAKIGEHPVGCGSAATPEADPAHVLPPGVTGKGPGLRVDSHPAAGGGKVDPAHVGAPAIAGQAATGIAVDAVIGQVATNGSYLTRLKESNSALSGFDRKKGKELAFGLLAASSISRTSSAHLRKGWCRPRYSSRGRV